MTRILILPVATMALAACATVTTAPAPAVVVVPPLNVAPATAAGPNFMARNAAAQSVVTTPSGLQYFVVKSGPATGAHPTGEDTVSFDYEGKLISGQTFDSSYTEGKPLVGQVSKFVPGFSEALKMMRPGDEWVVWIPPELGYGAKEVGPIPANSVLRFTLALHSVTPAP
ncbi:MAG: FKBP-type peptidyl-prolyl cis-trans isomerase [Sphingomicrobium sp.]